MSLDVTTSDRARLSIRAGTATLLLGTLFLAASGYAYVLSLSEVVDPPHWARVAGLVWLPIGLVGVPVAYEIARTGPGRGRGRLGVIVALAGALAFVALVVVAG